MDRNKFLIQEVINDLLNVKESLSGPLLKLYYFGKQIKNQDLIDFTNREINGYRDADAVPKYRLTIARLYVDLIFYDAIRSVEIPISSIQDSFAEALKDISIREGIGALEKLAEEKSNDQIYTALPMQMLYILKEPIHKFYANSLGINSTGARVVGNANIISEIPNAIRTKLLDFLTSIADTFGYDIEIESFNKKADSNNQTINYYMQTTITNSGDGNVIATGNENKISNNVSLYKGDLSRLEKELSSKGIDKDDIAEIADLVKTEKPTEQGNLGTNTINWILKVSGKALAGAGKIAIGVSSNLLASYIKQYHGLPM